MIRRINPNNLYDRFAAANVNKLINTGSHKPYYIKLDYVDEQYKRDLKSYAIERNFLKQRMSGLKNSFFN